jgi:hypothetical protein
MAIPKSSKQYTRKDPRITKVLPVDCRIVELSPLTHAGQGMKKWQRFPARTINVSKTGMLINSDFEIDPQTKVEMTFSLKSGEEENHQVVLLAEVARSRRNAYDLFGRWAMGLRILEIDPKDFSLVSEYFIDSK